MRSAIVVDPCIRKILCCVSPSFRRYHVVSKRYWFACSSRLTNPRRIMIRWTERERVQSCRSNRRQTRRWNRGCRRMREGEEEGERWERESLGERLLSLTRGEGKMTGRMLINQPRVLFGLWHEGLFLFPSPPSLSSKDVYAARGCFNRVEETNRVTQLTLSSVTSTLCFRASPPSFLHPPPSLCLSSFLCFITAFLRCFLAFHAPSTAFRPLHLA